MGQFIFRMPENTPDLDFGSLQRLLWPATTEHKIGTTVTITGTDLNSDQPGVAFRLYDTVIAVIRRESVEFPVTGDAHMATGEWVAKIIRDNAIGTSAGRIRRRKADPLVSGPRGYVGPLAVNYDRDRLVEGHAYPVGDIEGMHRRRHEAQEHRAAERERWVPYYERSNVVWEASRLHRALAGDEQAARDLDDLGIRLDTGQAETRLAALTAQLAGLDARLAELGLPAGDEPRLLAELTARNSRKQETRS